LRKCVHLYSTHTQATHKHNSATQPATTRRPRQQQAAAAAAAASYYHHPTTAQAAAAEQHAVAPAATHSTYGMHRTARTARTHVRAPPPLHHTHQCRRQHLPYAAIAARRQHAPPPGGEQGASTQPLTPPSPARLAQPCGGGFYPAPKCVFNSFQSIQGKEALKLVPSL
jgi:hypothetical protein